ncbi:MAG: tetratricopeptide repeat protein [Saprospiraceae bacterium]|nr:tetratricopeptide repeat protein [Saprospiraceae bacterium]
MDKFDPKHQKTADTMYKVLLLLTFLCLFACKTSSNDATEEIARLEANLAESPSQETLQQLLVLYQEMASQTKDSKRLDYLWKAGETARAVRDFAAAEKIFEDIYENHPDNELASKALFLHAFMCDEDLKQYDRAKELYVMFMDKYPDSDFADDAEFLLTNIGKSDEEMLELLSKSQEQK